MQVYVSKDGKQYGPYAVEQLLEYVQQGNFTAEDLACHDGKNWVTIAEVPGFAEATQPPATPSPTIPKRAQAVKEKPIEQQPASANASNSPAKKKKIILWSSIGGIATLLVAGLLIWILGGDEGVPESNHSPASPPPDAKIAQVGKIDLDDPETFKKIVAKAVNFTQLQSRGKKGEELLYLKNQPKPYTGWSKWMHGNGQIKFLTQRKDGKRDGLQMWWYENGRKRGESTFKDGKKDGLQTWWYENLQKRGESTWKDGRIMTSVVWKPNGEKCLVTNVVNGNGVKVSYNNDGAEKERNTYREGELVSD